MRSDRSIDIVPAGDAMITRRLRQWEGVTQYDQLVEEIRGADAAIVNLETLLHDFEGYPASQNPGIAMRAPPWAADELTRAGFDMVTTATNHAIDYSHDGMETTMQHLDARDIPYAGMGRTLAEARSPAYLDTPGGRVGLVNACTTVTTGSEAGPAGGGVKGRPGISPIQLSTRYTVPADDYDRLQEIHTQLGLSAFRAMKDDLGFPIPGDEGFTFIAMGSRTHPRIEKGNEYSVEREPAEADIRAVLENIRTANAQADWVVASLHAHEGAGARANDETTAPFITDFARACIDAGADLFVGHGPHCLRGIDVYRGRPIFYSLGNFIAQNETTERIPPELFDRYDIDPPHTPARFFDWRYSDGDNNRTSFLADRKYFQSVLPAVHLSETGPTTIELFPIELGFDQDRARRGTPSLATGSTATSILDELIDLAEPFGADIEVDGSVGRLHITDP